LFKNIQKAYETLSNVKTKRAYDSKDPFDDSIPSMEEITCDADFFEIFGELFARNAKWSISGASMLGDETTPYEKVSSFYSFWFTFKSWRDFGYLDEYDLEEAENRDERRWMEKENSKKRMKLEKAERLRIFSFVDMAYKLDPRVKKQLLLEQKEKEEALNRKKLLKEEKLKQAKLQQEKEEEEKRRQIEAQKKSK